VGKQWAGWQQISGNRCRVWQGQGPDEWYTPAQYVDAVSVVLGAIDFNPASSDQAQKIVQARTYYTAKEDDLKQVWPGTVFLNPPFGRGLIDRYVKEMLVHFEIGEVPNAVVLLNNSTEMAGWQSLSQARTVICLVNGRTGFLDCERPIAEKSYPGSDVCIFGRSNSYISNAFSNIRFNRDHNILDFHFIFHTLRLLPPPR
jgi:hypothetical protein